MNYLYVDKIIDIDDDKFVDITKLSMEQLHSTIIMEEICLFYKHHNIADALGDQNLASFIFWILHVLKKPFKILIFNIDFENMKIKTNIDLITGTMCAGKSKFIYEYNKKFGVNQKIKVYNTNDVVVKIREIEEFLSCQLIKSHNELLNDWQNDFADVLIIDEFQFLILDVQNLHQNLF